MESTILGVVLDSSVLIAAERAGLKTPDRFRIIRSSIGDVPIVISALSVAELAHGIYRAQTAERGRQRRQFLDELKSQIPNSGTPSPPATSATLAASPDSTSSSSERRGPTLAKLE